MNFNFKNFNIKIYPDSSDCREKVFIPNQSHSSNFTEIITGGEDLNNYDGLITLSREFKLGIKTADCIPICLGDGKKIGIIHIGWRGLCSDLYEKVFRQFDVNRLEIYVGPFLHSFSIKKDYCYDAIIKKFGEKFIMNSKGGIFFDFEGAIKSIVPKNTVFDERNMKEDTTLPSNRRNGTKDRILTVVSFK